MSLAFPKSSDMFQDLLVIIYGTRQRPAGYATTVMRRAFLVGRPSYPDCSLVSAIRLITKHQRPSNENANRSQATSGAYR
jgi:hypothetical protein